MKNHFRKLTARYQFKSKYQSIIGIHVYSVIFYGGKNNNYMNVKYSWEN